MKLLAALAILAILVALRLRRPATSRPSGLIIITAHRGAIEAEARAATLARVREAVRWQGTLRQNFAARVNLAFDKDHAARASGMLDWAIDEVFAALIDAEEGREPSEDLCSNCGYPYAGHDPRGDACPTGEGTYKYSPTAEDYAMGNMASGHEHWDIR